MKIRDKKKKQRPTFEVADIFAAYGHKLKYLPWRKEKVKKKIAICRTAAAGGHTLRCNTCGIAEISYNSCRDRHCPKCEFMKSNRWISDRKGELLQANYFHMVFTIPSDLRPVIFQNQEKGLGYNLLFKAVSYSLKKIGADPKHLGGDLGFFAVLHTWNQKLEFHPHIHCVVAGGALSKDRKRWISSGKEYFLPVKVLSKIFRAKLLKLLEKAHKKEQLDFWGDYAELKVFSHFKELLKKAAQKDWVVFSKQPFKGPEQTISYLSRYTHRIAISNRRIISIADGQVTFSWLDRSKKKKKVMTLDAVVFMKRFLLHVLPKGFVKIRFYGFMGHKVKKELLARCRFLITGEEEFQEESEPVKESWDEIYKRITGVDLLKCSKCEKGRLVKQKLSIPPKRRSMCKSPPAV